VEVIEDSLRNTVIEAIMHSLLVRTAQDSTKQNSTVKNSSCSVLYCFSAVACVAHVPSMPRKAAL